MTIFESGSLNAAALTVPGLYLNIVPPQLLLNGVPTTKTGIVGMASWGPVGVPVPVSDYASFVREFGPLAARTGDMGTAVALASMQGATNLSCVRVTDASDVAATGAVQTTGLTLAAKYTGTFGNGISLTVSPGSKAATWRVSIVQANSGRAPEVFDNLALGLTANPVWVAIASAINNGVAGQRSASELVIATAGALTTAPTAGSVTLTGGSDGGIVTASQMVGTDSVPRKGMYALRKTGCSQAMLADVVDVTTWPTQVAYGLSEGTYMMLVGPAGQTAAQAATAKTTAGIDTRIAKVIVGDWIYWLDPVLGYVRMVSPQGIFVGVYGALAPHLSGLNRPVNGVVGTQRSMSGAPYGDAELQIMALNGLDVITTPIPAGNVFGIRFGRNASSSASEHGDNATRMTNFIAATLDAAMGKFVGKPTTDESLRQTETTMGAYLDQLRGIQGEPDSEMIEDYRVICRPSNNPPQRRALGYRQATAQVRYLSITEFFIINLEGGQAVTITRQSAAA